MPGQNLSKKANYIAAAVIAAVFLCAAAFLLWRVWRPAPDQAVALLTVDGEIVLQIDLAKVDEPQTVDLAPYGVPGKLELSQHRARFIEVTCPDHLCEQMGYVQKETDTAVCLPNRAALSVVTAEEARSLAGERYFS